MVCIQEKKKVPQWITTPCRIFKPSQIEMAYFSLFSYILKICFSLPPMLPESCSPSKSHLHDKSTTPLSPLNRPSKSCVALKIRHPIFFSNQRRTGNQFKERAGGEFCIVHRTEGIEQQRAYGIESNADWRLPTENCPLRTANCQLRTANWELPTEDCQLPTEDCELPLALCPKIT